MMEPIAWFSRVVADSQGWICDVCGAHRPQELIVTTTHTWESPERGRLTQRVQHCTDRPACVHDAPYLRWLPGDFQPVETAS